MNEIAFCVVLSDAIDENWNRWARWKRTNFANDMVRRKVYDGQERKRQIKKINWTVRSGPIIKKSGLSSREEMSARICWSEREKNNYQIGNHSAQWIFLTFSSRSNLEVLHLFSYKYAFQRMSGSHCAYVDPAGGRWWQAGDRSTSALNVDRVVNVHMLIRAKKELLFTSQSDFCRFKKRNIVCNND